MKKLTLIVTAALLLMVPSLAVAQSDAAGEDKGGPVEIRRFSAMNFTEIKVGAGVRLTVEDRRDNVMIVRAEEEMLSYLRLSVADGRLTASLDEAKLAVASVSVSSPVVEVLVPNNREVTSMSASGASFVEFRQQVNVDTFKAELSDNAVLKINLLAKQAEFDVSGSSVLDLVYSGKSLTLNASGQSDVYGRASAATAVFEASGTSSIGLKGSAGIAEIGLSGAATYSGAGLRIKNCTVTASGASDAQILCTKSLSAEASGNAGVGYTGGCELTHLSTSGTGTVQRVK